jgi:hypothetical protein
MNRWLYVVAARCASQAVAQGYIPAQWLVVLGQCLLCRYTWATSGRTLRRKGALVWEGASARGRSWRVHIRGIYIARFLLLVVVVVGWLFSRIGNLR